jgi:hypothetical protein
MIEVGVTGKTGGNLECRAKIKNRSLCIDAMYGH